MVVLLLVLGAEFVNGFHDAPNAIATVVSTRVMRPYQALLMAAVLNVTGALWGTAVAHTIGTGFVKPEVVGLGTVAGGVIAVILWNTLTWLYALPTSTSHALVAGITGAGLAVAGPKALLSSGWVKVVTGLGFSTFVGFALGLVIMTVLYRIFARSTPLRVRRIFGRLQVLSAASMAFAHGSNDGQKFIGVFTLTLLLAGVIKQFHVPIWVIFICAITMGLGTAVGGSRIIRTMGMRLTHLEPVQGFAAETSAALSILLASHLGVPLSTTHTINTAIMGVGATRRLSAVRWGVGSDIVSAWVLTFPACALIGFLVGCLERWLF